MTADIIHSGHINIIKSARALCDRLIVGVTTDSIAIQQKRRPVVPFEDRRAVIAALDGVDAAVEHCGESKASAWEKLGFDILFIGSDYVGSHEYESFARSHPHVKVVYLPRTTGVSSTSIIRNALIHTMSEHTSIVTHGVNGPLWRVNVNGKGPSGDSIIIKTVSLGRRELTACAGDDVYDIAYPPPRNWKGCEQPHSYPMISGVNAWREVMVHTNEFTRFPWNPVLSWHRVPSPGVTDDNNNGGHGRSGGGTTRLGMIGLSGALNDNNNNNNCSTSIGPPPDYTQHMSRIAIMQAERSVASGVVQIVQRDCGPTLKTWAIEWQTHLGRESAFSKFKSMCRELFRCIDDMRCVGIIHGDVHAENVCLGYSGCEGPYIIDFGWCMSSSFAMNTQEREYYNECMRTNFDWRHFCTSLKELPDGQRYFLYAKSLMP